MKTTTIPSDLSSVGLSHPQVESTLGDRLHMVPANLSAEIARGRLWLVSDARPVASYGRPGGPCEDRTPPHQLVVADSAPVGDGIEVARVVGLE